MSETPLFPGQVERLEFNLEQVRAIASPARSEVFWTFSSTEPLSANDVAQRMNRSPGTVHYHTNELVRVGLLIQVADRRSGARTERLYVRIGRRVYGKGHPMTDEYRREAARGFDAIMRALGRERATLHRVLPHDPDLGPACMFSLLNLRLHAEDAALLRLRLQEVLQEFISLESTEGLRLRVAVVTHPDMGELRQAYRKATGDELRSESTNADEAP